MAGDRASSTLDRPAPPAPIDPRIRARRIEVARGEGRRRLRRLADAAVVGTVALGFLAALWSPLLDVDEVRISGAERSGADVIADHADIEVGDQLVSVDLGAAGARIAELPWVAEVSLRRGVDGVVAIEVTERVPVAVVPTSTGPHLVDRDGRILAPAAAMEELGPLTALDGVDAQPVPGRYLDDRAEAALRVAARLAEDLPGALATLGGDDLSGRLAQGGTVRFGDASQLDAKVRSLRTVLDQVDLTCLAVLDLRLPGSPVLTREEGCS